MILEHQGKTLEINLKSMLVTLKLSIKNKSVGDTTSTSDTLSQGIKPKSLTVSGLVLYEDAEKLKELVKWAEKTNSDGSPAIHTIDDQTANLGEVRQVIFDRDFNIKKMAQFEAWQIDFTLLQKNTVAEQKESRSQPTTTSVGDTATGTVVASEEIQSTTTQEHGAFYNAMLTLESYLEPAVENNQEN
jgi:hypothetical protein